MRQAGHGSPQSLSQGSHCPLVPMPPLWGLMGCTSRGSPPTTPLHGEPTIPPLQQDSSWTPPGNICFRLEPPSAHRELRASARVSVREGCWFCHVCFLVFSADCSKTPMTLIQLGTLAHPIRESAPGGFAAVGTRSNASVRYSGPLGLQETPSPKAGWQQGQDKGTQLFQPMSPVCVKLAPINAITIHDQQRVY